MGEGYNGLTLQAAAAATANGVAFPLINNEEGPYSTVAFQVTGTFTATITFEATLGRNTTQSSNTWVAIPAENVTTGAVATTATAAGVYRANVAGFAFVRARLTWSSGTSVTVIAFAIDEAAVRPSLATASLGVVSFTGQYAEDVAHTSGDTGVPALIVRKDTPVALGADGDYTLWQSDSSGRAWTHVGAIEAGETLIGLVGSSDIVVTVTPTLDTNAYTSGDLLFDSTAIANAVRANGYTAILQSVTIIDKDDQGAAMTLLIADTNTDYGTLNSAPDADDTEAATTIGWVPVATTDYIDLGGAKVACVRGIGLLCKAGGSTTSLYVAAMTGGTPTHSASGLVLQLGFLRA